MAPGAKLLDFANWIGAAVKELKGLSPEAALVPGSHGSLSGEYGLIVTLCYNELTDKGGSYLLSQELSLFMSMIRYFPKHVVMVSITGPSGASPPAGQVAPAF